MLMVLDLDIFSYSLFFFIFFLYRVNKIACSLLLFSDDLPFSKRKPKKSLLKTEFYITMLLYGIDI